jgi:hypothetical protein
MAENSGHNESVDQLKTQLARSREHVARELRGLHYELDFPAKFRRSFRTQTVSWLSAAAAVGALVALAPLRRKKIYVDAKGSQKSKKKLVETGLALGVLKIAANMARPAIVEFVKSRLTDFGGSARGGRKR